MDADESVVRYIPTYNYIYKNKDSLKCFCWYHSLESDAKFGIVIGDSFPFTKSLSFCYAKFLWWTVDSLTIYIYKAEKKA